MGKEYKYLSQITYRVPYADTDQMGVVYYANYLVYFERLRNEMLRRGDSSYRKMELEGYYLPVVEVQVEYLGSARYDDLLEVKGWLAWAKGARLRIDYEIKREEDLLTTGHTVHALINHEGQPRRIPSSLTDLFFVEGERS